MRWAGVPFRLRMPDRYVRLLHPAFLVALVVLLVNDHVLKAAVPSAATGKLSDLGGLVVLPVLLCTVVGLERRSAVWAVHLGVGVAFAVLQLVPTEAVASLGAVLGLPLRHTPDPTDVAALAVLPVGAWLAQRPASRAPRRLAPVALAASVFAVAATSMPLNLALIEEEPIARAATPLEALEALEWGLAAEGIEADRRPFPSREEIARDLGRDLDDPVVVETNGRLRAREARGEATYRISFAHPVVGGARDSVFVVLDLLTAWDEGSGALVVTLREPRGTRGFQGSAPERRLDELRAISRARVIRPLQASGVRTEAD